MSYIFFHIQAPSCSIKISPCKSDMSSKGIPVFTIFNTLLVSSILDTIPVPVLMEEEDEEVTVIAFEEEDDYTITRDDHGTFIVEGPWIKKLIGSTNFDDAESLTYFQNALRRKGVIKDLVKKGCAEGDAVQMYDVEFDFVD